MSDNSDQLALLGQQVVDAVIATYNPRNDPSLALALHPGQALADDIVQNGVTNALRLSEWIEDQFDYPLWLKRSDASSISASSVGGVPAKSAYLAMIPWAQPTVSPDAPAFSRITAMIADARRDIGDNPSALPFSCEPTDFAEPDSAAWHVFDQTISTSAKANTSAPTAPVRVDPMLWKMRVLTSDFVNRLSPASALSVRQKVLSAQLGEAPRAYSIEKGSASRSTPFSIIAAAQAKPPRFIPTAEPAIASSARDTQMSSRRAALRTRKNVLPMPVAAPISADPVSQRHIPSHAALLDRLSTIQTHDLAAAPVVEQVTKTGSDLHAHFEFCMLTITRRLAGTPWWHSDLINEDEWCVPGMERGAMVPASTDGSYARCLPQALLLVRNAAFTGAWTADAKSSLTSQVSFLGPFLMGAPMANEIDAASAQQISVLGQGIQVIGELCSILPALPPKDGTTSFNQDKQGEY